MLKDPFKNLFNELKEIIPSERIFTDELHTYAYGTDASLYRLVPKIAVKVGDEKDLLHTIKSCNKNNIPFTFRGSGTSLSGQAISDSVLVIMNENWAKIKINDDGTEVELQPGVLGREVNRLLAKYQRKLGPDPASIDSAMIGGIAANNASGMTSGTVNNTYNTLAGMKIIFVDGYVLDTSDESSRNEFKNNKKEFITQLITLVDEIKSNEKLKEKINNKYRMKNTCGYGLNSLLDFNDPIDIISHLMIGSEGTLGFISRIKLNTVPDLPYKATALLLIKNISLACRMIPALSHLQVRAAELMDHASLRSVEGLSGIPEEIKNLNDDATALLVETSANNEDELFANINLIKNELDSTSLIREISFTTDLKERLSLWKVRKGLFTSGCKNRKPGTTVIIEDLNFPLERLDEAVTDLTELLKKHSYNNSFIWGHALSGNIHFVITQKFSTNDEVSRYNSFMKEVVKLVVEKYDGSLKAEHGTGRNMAPFVKYEWGNDAYEIMKRIKLLFDPNNLMNPGVLINPDQEIHLKNIKSIPVVHEIIDKCTECGFCESTCPSRNLTLTPRQRITLLRKYADSNNSFNNSKLIKDLSKEFRYNFDETCAVDGMCSLNCPVDIDTGKIVKIYRSNSHSRFELKVASYIANNFQSLTFAIRLLLRSAHLVKKIFGDKFNLSISKTVSKFTSGRIPIWNKSVPLPTKNIKTKPPDDRTNLVYFPSCINRIFGRYNNDNSDTISSVEKVLLSSCFKFIIPPETGNLCCGMAFSSKGFFNQDIQKSNELYKTLLRYSNNGEIPILFDTSPCAIHFKSFLRENNYNNITVYEPIDFIFERILKKIKLNRLNETIAIHSVCSIKKYGNTNRLEEIAHLCAKKVITTASIDCCGFAGDRGFTFPELNESALLKLSEAISNECNYGFSTSRTCEIGLTKKSGIYFNSIFNLLDKCISTESN